MAIDREIDLQTSLSDVLELPPLERLVVLGLVWGEIPVTDLARAMRGHYRTVALARARATKRLAALWG